MTDKESLQFIIDTFNDLSQKPQDIGLMFKFCDAHSRVKKSLERLNHIESSLKIFIEKLKKDRDKEIMMLRYGLCGKKDDFLYDSFRNRIMFPIHNSNGDAVGFSARIYNNEVDSKYINTRETYIFKKGEIIKKVPLKRHFSYF